jgi:hypothetical protein
MDMNRYILHAQKQMLLHSLTLDVADGSTTHQDAWMLPSFTHVLCCNTYSKFLTPPIVATASRGPEPPHYHSFTITLRCATLLGLLLTSDQPDTKTPIWEHTTLTRDRHPCLRRDSNSQSQQANGGRPIPYTAQALGLAKILKYSMYSCGTVGWSTALQTGRPWIRFPMVSLEFFIDIIFPAALWPWALLGL